MESKERTDPIFLVFGLVKNKENEELILAIKNKELKPPGRQYMPLEDEKLALKVELNGLGIETSIRNYRVRGRKTIQIDGEKKAVSVLDIGNYSGETPKESKYVWVKEGEVPLLDYFPKMN